MNASKLLAVVITLQIMLLMGQWFGGPVTPALAQIPDAGAQRLQIIDELKSSNEKLDKLISILESGKLQVQVTKPDEADKK